MKSSFARCFALGSFVLVNLVSNAGCAAPTDAPADAPTDAPADDPFVDGPVPAPERDVAPTESHEVEAPVHFLGAGSGNAAESLVLEIAKGAARQLGAELFSFLFKSSDRPTLTLEDFIKGVDASIATALAEQAKQGNVDLVTQAQLELQAVQASTKAAGDDANRRAVVAANMDSNHYFALSSLARVTAGLGPSASLSVREAGLRLFITAAQLQIAKLEMQAKLDRQRYDLEDLKTYLTSDNGWIAHVVKTANDMRVSAVQKRIGLLGNCSQVYYSQRTGAVTYGFWDGDTRHDETGYNAQLAAARCNTIRDRHIAALDEEVTRELDLQQRWVYDVIEEWQTLARSLEPATQSRTFIGYDFGGMYGRGAPNGGAAQWFSNPAVGSASCPAGYEDQEIFGRAYIDYPVHACVRRATPGSISFVDFQGMFGDSYYADRATRSTNPFTGQAYCTEGSWGVKLLDDRDLDNQLYACVRPHIAGTGATFGGTYSRRSDRGNPITAGFACPYGFAPKATFGSQPGRGLGHEDDDLTFCWKAF